MEWSRMGRLRWAAVSVLLLLLLPSSSLGSEKVTVSVYYEALCPFCANFVVYHLVKLFENGLISAVNLRMIPWGNAWIQPDGAFLCQHGPDECMLNTIEACTISIYPDTENHFRFIHCVEGMIVENRHNEWTKCFQIVQLSAVPIDCYKNGHGRLDYQNFMTYICKAYTGKPAPDACRTLMLELDDRQYLENASGGSQVCYATPPRNSTS